MKNFSATHKMDKFEVNYLRFDDLDYVLRVRGFEPMGNVDQNRRASIGASRMEHNHQSFQLPP